MILPSIGRAREGKGRRGTGGTRRDQRTCGSPPERRRSGWPPSVRLIVSLSRPLLPIFTSLYTSLPLNSGVGVRFLGLAFAKGSGNGTLRTHDTEGVCYIPLCF